jgi:polyhydroxybutyrate depolymerase
VIAKPALALAGLLAAGCADEPDVPPDGELLAGRPYQLVVPSSYSRERSAPLLLVLHGYASSAASIDNYYRFGTIAEREGFLYATPEGSIDAAGNRAWNVSPIHFPPWDVDYLRAVITQIRGRHAVDERRIYVVGLSAGGHMAHRAACDLSTLLAAVVSVAGQVPTDPRRCATTSPVSVLQVHGDEDEVIGYHGDVRRPPDPRVPSALQTVSAWARNNGCAGDLLASGQRLDLLPGIDGEETRVDAFGGCPPGIAVQLWTMEGGSHHPPVAPSWPDRLYDFLRAHPRP